MKDFYDIWTLVSEFEFDGRSLSNAIRATFERRQTQIPTQTPLALTTELGEDRAKATQWTGFLRKGNLTNAPASLTDVTAWLEPFLMQPTAAIVAEQEFDMAQGRAVGMSGALAAIQNEALANST